MARLSRRTAVPQAILSTYAQLRRRYNFPISLKRISGHYYLYKQIIKWDKEAKKYICLQMQYLGAFSSDGEFRPKKMIENDIDSAKALIAAHGGVVIMQPEPILQSKQTIGIGELDRTILTELTMDGRVAISDLAKRLGENERKISYRIRSLEKKLDIVYKPKINLESLGYLHFIVFVKFESSRPDPDLLEQELGSIASVQFAALTSSSKYDMVLIIATTSDYNSDYNPIMIESLPAVMRKLRMTPSLKDIAADWYISYFDIIKGFLPLRESFLEEYLSKSVWTRRQEKRSNSISKNEYATLRAINQNGAVSFREIEHKNGMSEGSAKYCYDALIKRKVISGTTICMRGLKTKYGAFILMEIIDEGLYSKTRKEVYRIETKEKEGHIQNRISLVANMGAPYGALFISPIINDGDLDDLQNEFYSNLKGIKISTMVPTKILCGAFPYNRLDNKKTIQYEKLLAYEKQKNEE